MRCDIILTIIGLIQLLPRDASAAAGDDCTAANVTTACGASGFICESLKCKVKAGVTCTNPTPNCIANAGCTGNPLKCTCTSAYYAAANSESCITKVALGVACPTADACTEGFCDSGFCKLKADGDCTGAKSDKCLEHATCGTNACACSNGYTKATDLMSCKINAGQACVIADNPTKCVEHATCKTATGAAAGPNGVCTCDDSYSGTTTCNGASGVVASLVLLLAAFVTSRFM